MDRFERPEIRWFRLSDSFFLYLQSPSGNMPFSPPYPPYDPTDKSGFSYDTVVKRWPIILTGVVDTLYKASHNLSLQVSAASDADKEDLKKRIEEGKGIIEKVGKLKYEMGR
ncbi:hypothetical protein CPB84DRAFT_1837155, partial [Gymnopilus junonius]